MSTSIFDAIDTADIQGKYLALKDLVNLTEDLPLSKLRAQAADTISQNAVEIVKEAGAKFLLDSKFDACGSHLHNTRRYTACIRDLDYFLRYTTYAMVANDCSILDQRLLQGLKQTYQAIGISIQSTVEALQAMKEVTTSVLEPQIAQEMSFYFDYICTELSH